jgi:hypothetical protein
MEPERFDVEISMTHANELRKTNPKKFDKLMSRLQEGLLDFPGVGCVMGPIVESTPEEIEEWDRIERESEARRRQEIKEALASALKEPKMKELVKSQVEKLFDSPGYQEKLARAVAGMESV